MQQLMTEGIERVTPRLYGTEGQYMESVATAHYFSPLSGWDWYLTEYEPETGEAFGLVIGYERELGYFSIRDFEQQNDAHYGLAIERDIYFTPCKLSDLA